MVSANGIYVYLLEQLNLANLCPSSAIKDHQSGPHYSKCRPHKSQANVNLLSAILNATYSSNLMQREK